MSAPRQSNSSLSALIKRAQDGDTDAAFEVLQLAVAFLDTSTVNRITKKPFPVPAVIRDYLAESLRKVAWRLEPADKALRLVNQRRRVSSVKYHHEQLAAELVQRFIAQGHSVQESANKAAETVAKMDVRNAPYVWRGFAGQQLKGATFIKWFYKIHPAGVAGKRLRKKPVKRKLRD